MPSEATPFFSIRTIATCARERSLVATIGIKGLVVVDTPDALLVADRIARKTSRGSSAC